MNEIKMIARRELLLAATPELAEALKEYFKGEDDETEKVTEITPKGKAQSAP